MPEEEPLRAASPPRFGFPARLTFLLLGVGALLRVAQYLANRSLWLDEAYLAPTILHRSFRELLSRAPEYGQVVPAGFLVLERAAVAAFGGSEYALRLVPLLAGLVSLWLFWRVAVRILPRNAVPLAVALFVVCDSLIYFSSELKQYGLDVAVALALLDRALTALENPGRLRPVLWLALLGAAAIWLSHPAVFVLAGIGATLGVQAVLRRDRAALLALGATGLLWAASFAICDIVWLSLIGRTPRVLSYWSRWFWPLPPRSFEDLYWLPRALGAVFSDPVGFVFRGLGIFCFLAGCIFLGSSNRPLLAVLVSPMLFTLLASGFKRYPFTGRLLLFVVPSILLLVAAGIEGIREATRARFAAVGTVLIALLLFHPTLSAIRNGVHPRTREEILPVLEYVKKKQLPGDRLYVYESAGPAFDYYSARFGLDPAATLRGHFDGVARDPHPDVEKLRGGGRTWIVFSHTVRMDGTDEEKRLLDLLDPIGIRLDTFRLTGAAAYLFDFRAGGH